MKSTFTILSEDNPGVLMRIAGLIYRRGYNIESLSVGQTDTPGISRFTVVIEGEGGDHYRAAPDARRTVSSVYISSIYKYMPILCRRDRHVKR